MVDGDGHRRLRRSPTGPYDLGINRLALAALALLLSATGPGEAATSKRCSAPPGIGGGFTTDFCRHLVPLSQFQAGGPGKDGIPAIDHPHFAPASTVDWLAFREPVIELALGH